MSSGQIFRMGWRARRHHVAERALTFRTGVRAILPAPRRSAEVPATTGEPAVAAIGGRMPRPSHILAGILLLALGALAYGQQSVGLTGSVTDITGAVIPGATVSARPAAGGSPVVATTDGAGEFQLTGLTPGDYRVTATAPSFAPLEQPVNVAAQNAPLHLALDVAHASETVSVTATGLAVETTSTETGGTLDAHQIETVPLNGRSFTDALAVQPGVAPASAGQANAIVMSGVASTPPSGELDSGALSIGGQRETANSFRVNGADAQEDVNMGVAIVPTLDSIAELNVATGNYAPEYGSASGGQIAVTTKSGTNDWRGSVFEFLRNTDLDARNYFSQERSAFHQNQFGGALGGPLRKDRLYFFADYQGTRVAEGIDTGLISVPTAAERAGNFATASGSLLTGCVGGPYLARLLTQKLGRTVQTGDPYSPASTGCAANRSSVFPDSVIPKSIWSSAAQHLLQYVPQANAGVGTFSTSAAEQQIRDDKGALRLDASSRIGSLAGYYFFDDYNLNDPYPAGTGGATVPGFNALNYGRAQLLSLSDTTTFGANTVNQARLSYMRNAANVGVPQGGVGPSLASQGFSGIVALAPQIEGVENVAFNDFTMGVDTTALFQAENIIEAADDWSHTAGAHDFKFGVDIHADQVNNHPDVYFNGSYSFTGNETGLDFADFLLGVDSSYTQGDARHFYNRNLLAGAYAQDVWRMRSGLTLNYGVRWDLLPPWSEKYNQLQTLVPGEQSIVFPNAPEGIVFPGDPGVPRTLAEKQWTDFAPRVGLAWTPRFLGEGKTSLRASWGEFYTPIEGLSPAIMSANPPYGYTYTSAVPTLFDTPWTAAADGSSLEPNGPRFPLAIAPLGASRTHPVGSVGWAQFEPFTGIPAVSPGNVSPYAEDYLVSVERELGRGTVLDVSYAGTQAHHLLTLLEANPGDPSLCLSLSEVSSVAAGSATCGPFGESGTYTEANGTVVQGTRTRFSPAFASVSWQKTIGNSHDNALEVSLKHDGSVFGYSLAYTWSQSIDQASSLSDPVNPIDPSLSRALSAFDLTHNLVANYHWHLPGAPAAWASQPWLRTATAGWTIFGLTRLTTGFPVTLINNNDTSLLGTQPNGVNNNGADQLSFTPGPLELQGSPRAGAAFNTALFSLPALGDFGNARRRVFHGPGSDSTDLALEKSSTLLDGKELQLRLEAFNLFNHAQFFGPSSVEGNIGSQTFGQIVSAAPPRLMQVSARLRF
ncbi:MAG TPA: carboxypeptidase regulatory-like domain-containing protein [Acidobacteriaceae bacterium]|nr:carboxypeptidase regulatory-like domain-containing protein [Acidobacteriaceae bacterium]